MALVNDNLKPNKFSPKNPKVCVICGKEFKPVSPRAKTCSERCSRIQENRKQREAYKRRYKKKGYNQKGENNNCHKVSAKPAHKERIYGKYRKVYCEICGKTDLETKLTFCVHHMDGDSTNNHPDNLITLCHSCHKLVHKGKIDCTERYSQ